VEDVMELEAQVAIVTGGGRGIGRATALELARLGADVVVAELDKAGAEQTAAEVGALGRRALAIGTDVTRRGDLAAMVQRTKAELGRIDILVNNAGISIHRNAARTTADDIERLFAVNYFAAVYLTTAALPGMLERRAGSIVNVTSVAGYVPNPGEAAYGATRAALSHWSHGLAVDLAGTGVHVGVVSPGPIDTEIWSLDEELSYSGKLFPPEVVADGVAKVIERELVHLTTPRRYGAVGALYPLFGKPMRWGLRRYEARQ
jgi:NAD(P)-dependent dehydrogenase (short-subunit alcohol dehydrogenase family)